MGWKMPSHRYTMIYHIWLDDDLWWLLPMKPELWGFSGGNLPEEVDFTGSWRSCFPCLSSASDLSLAPKNRMIHGDSSHTMLEPFRSPGDDSLDRGLGPWATQLLGTQRSLWKSWVYHGFTHGFSHQFMASHWGPRRSKPWDLNDGDLTGFTWNDGSWPVSFVSQKWFQGTVACKYLAANSIAVVWIFSWNQLSETLPQLYQRRIAN